MRKLSTTLFAAMVALVLLGGQAVYAEDHDTVGATTGETNSADNSGGHGGGDGLYDRTSDPTAPIDGVWDTTSDEDMDPGKVKSNS